MILKNFCDQFLHRNLYHKPREKMFKNAAVAECYWTFYRVKPYLAWFFFVPEPGETLSLAYVQLTITYLGNRSPHCNGHSRGPSGQFSTWVSRWNLGTPALQNTHGTSWYGQAAKCWSSSLRRYTPMQPFGHVININVQVSLCFSFSWFCPTHSQPSLVHFTLILDINALVAIFMFNWPGSIACRQVGQVAW